MESFRWIVTAIAMILGLSITRLLSGLIEIFRSRSHATLDWIPLVWAAGIFVAQLQFWWAILELHSLVKQWTLGSFLLLISLPLLLFVTAALILPPQGLKAGESLRTSFERDGRWALAAFSSFFILAIVVDWHFWHAPLWSLDGVLNASLALLPFTMLLTSQRRIEAAVTCVYIVLHVAASLIQSPSAYD